MAVLPTPVPDVYAADSGLCEATAIHPRATYEFEIEGDADPNVLALVSNLACLVNVAPRSCRMLRTAEHRVAIWIELEGIGRAKANSIKRKLEQLTCIDAVTLIERDARPDAIKR
jgi:hypothetical protein